MTNYGGVRINELPAGDITVLDALKIDPYDNKTIVLTLTGQQLTDLLLSISRDRANKFPFISGLRCKVTPSKENPEKIGSIKLTTHDGKKLDMKRHYTVTTNSYVATTNKLPEDCVVTVHDMMTNDLLIQYLEKKQTVSYKGIRRLSFK
jgi:2',3'-cyclic-nucleotide 2'-phosphodiesterase (5'-nucleotidase family)